MNDLCGTPLGMNEGKRSFLNETEQYLLETQIAIGNSREANNAVS